MQCSLVNAVLCCADGAVCFLVALFCNCGGGKLYVVCGQAKDSM
jgi:hypothetical protein